MLVRWLLLAATASAANASWVSHQGHCPVKACHLKEQHRTSLLQTGSSTSLELAMEEPQVPLPLKTTAERPFNDRVHETDPDTGLSLYNLEFKSGHFMCSKCDQSACPNCNTVCDLSSCMGEFYTQECWCRKESQVKLETPMFWFREYDARWLLHDTVKRGFCDSDCSGGVCDMPGLQCKKREEACKPWWWCNLDPPSKEQEKDNWPTGYEYTSSMTFLQEDSVQEKRTVDAEKPAFLERKSTASTAAHVRRSASDSALVASAKKLEFEANDFGKMTFETGSWECTQAGLPPKVQDATSFLWNDRGYIVFDSPSCSGGAFDKKCYCWDEVELLKGADPKTSELHCDAGCGLGPCAGNTCSSSPPPQPTAPPPPPVLDPVQMEGLRASELKTSNNKMDPMPT